MERNGNEGRGQEEEWHSIATNGAGIAWMGTGIALSSIVQEQHVWEQYGKGEAMNGQEEESEVMKMLLKCIATGSKGNSYALISDSEILLIEAGVPLMEVKKAIDFRFPKLSGVWYLMSMVRRPCKVRRRI